jgi:curved DNA-binding protein CbpA
LRAQQPPSEPAPAPGPDLSATLTRRLLWGEETSEHRRLVLETYRRIDWTSHYDLLGVPPEAGPKEIEEAYRSRRVLFDPDLHTRGDLAGCNRQLQVLSARLAQAYEILVHSAKRNAYDEKLRAEETLIEKASETGKGRASVSPSDASEEIRKEIAHQNYLRAKELIEKKDYFTAIQMLQEAVRLVPKHGEYRYLLDLAQMKTQLEGQETGKPGGRDGQDN